MPASLHCGESAACCSVCLFAVVLPEFLKRFHRFPAINQPWQPGASSSRSHKGKPDVEKCSKTVARSYCTFTPELFMATIPKEAASRRTKPERRPDLPQFTLVLFTLYRRGLSAEKPELTAAGTGIQAVRQHTRQPVHLIYEEHLRTTIRIKANVEQ